MKSMRKTAALVLILGLIGFLPPGAWAAEEAAPAASNILLGKVFMAKGEVPVDGGTVRAYHMGSGNLFSGLTSPETGSFLLSGLPDGSYEISIQTADGDFYLDQVVTISGGVRNFMSFSLTPGPLSQELQDRLGRREINPAMAAGMAEMVPEGGDPGATGTTGAKATAITLGIVGGLGLMYLLLDDDDGSPK